jgi:hypothetical protein
MATKSNSASCTSETLSLLLSCYRFSVFYGSTTASNYHNNQQRYATVDPMMYCETDSAFYAYWQWCENQQVLWEYEQELADQDNNNNNDNSEDLSNDN